ncbi:MAG: hypothetical protein V1776_05720 [Candidatus Diapherotrites archaeon]
MRGFVFTLDMALAAAGVLLLFLILIQSISYPVPSTAFDRIRAKDATMSWFYTGIPVILPTPSPEQYACDLGFRPRVSTDLLDPNDVDDWIIQNNCVEAP